MWGRIEECGTVLRKKWEAVRAWIGFVWFMIGTNFGLF
jgi:hypothetical protein